MINFKQLQARRSGMAERSAALMELHFAGVDPAWLWLRKSNHGFTTVPRTLPIAMQAVDQQEKGHPSGHTLFCLWARAPDHPLVVIENPATFAGEAGFSGVRAVDTWRRRMRLLQKHNFLLAKRGTSGEFHYVLLLNPNAAVEYMRYTGLIQEDLYGRFKDRLAEVGAANDLKRLHEHWAVQKAAQAIAQGVSTTESAVVKIPGG